MLEGHISIHIYSIQPSLPKDPAALWSAEYVQSEELFRQPSDLDNCLRDNRFSAVSCSAVTRKVTETSLTGTASKVSAKPSGADKLPIPTSGNKIAAPSRSPQKQSTVQTEVSAAPGHISAQSKRDGDGDSTIDLGNTSKGPGTLERPGSKPGPVSKKKTTGTGDGGSLANLWGRAGSKLKPVQAEAPAGLAPNSGNIETSELAPDPFSDDSDDEDATHFAHLRRGDMKNKSKRTRRMVLDDDSSDENNVELEEENIISLSSPEVPKERPEKSTIPVKNGKGFGIPVLPLDRVKDDTPVIESKKSEDGKILQVDARASESAPAAVNGTSTASAPELKKRKVLKTRIDERGREVTEVIWETESPASKDNKNEDNTSNCADVSHGTVQLEPVEIPNIKLNAKATAGKTTGTKATGGKSSAKISKDSQQGRISSFFKKKN
ncbi:hypothetical protein KP509_02G033900 [Ceratopteris richardii]|nr:hypothetical protein KP509_02G033900 [Ceratopteris richardii]